MADGSHIKNLFMAMTRQPIALFSEILRIGKQNSMVIGVT